MALGLGSQPGRSNPSPSPPPNPQPNPHIDPAQLPGFPVIWSHDSSESAPALLGGLVVAIEPNSREVAALDARTGALRWRVAAPKGVTWSAVQAHSPDWLLVTGYGEGSANVLGRLSLQGELRWHVTTGSASEARLADASGLISLLDRGGCLMRVLDGQRGRMLPHELRGHHIEYFGKGGPHSTCQVSATPHLLSHGLLIASDYRGRDALRAVDARSQVKWEIPGRYFRLLDADRSGDTATFFGYTLEQAPELLQVQLSSGKLLWQRKLTGACAEDRMSRHPQVIGRQGPKPVVLLQDCVLAELIELRSGTILWTRMEPRPDTLSLLADSQPVELGVGETGNTFSVSAGRSPAVLLRWVTVSGESAGSATLAADTREVELVPGGVVAHNHDLNRLWMVRQDGSTAWEVAVRFGNAFRRDDVFVILPSESGTTTQVMVDLKSGRRHALAFDSPYVLGRVAGEPGLWLTTRRRPASVVGVRTGL